MKKKYDVAAYVWPAYTGKEPRAWIFWNEGCGEWQSVKSAKAKFEGHTWPRKPLWGYVDEADPYVMSMEIEAAVAHGVNVFIYDWYWYDHRPFLENCLNDGFLKAPNKDKMKFYLCWANHNGSMFWDKRNADRPEAQGDVYIWDGATDRTEFNKVVERVITKYFVQDNYYKIDGCPVFNIYYLQNLINGLGGIEETIDALNYFREETKKAGFPDLNLQLTLRGKAKLSHGEGTNLILSDKTLDQIKVDSATHYQTLSFADMNRDYAEIIPEMIEEWEARYEDKHYKYYPHVSIGWDNNVRTNCLMPTVCKNNTPENFEKALREAKKFIDKHNIEPALVTINSWNEWTETSYLEPDDIYGYGYLEAVKHVFVDQDENN